jgi:glycosyltransferase involved in cell wall biosynthesis
MKVLFLIRSLGYGGAERQLVLLAKGLAKRGHDVIIAVFYSGGPLEKELCDAKVRIRPLNKRGRWDLLRFLMRLRKTLKEERPDIIHGYMYEPNLLTVIGKAFSPEIKAVLGVRSSHRDFNKDWPDWLGRLSFKLNCWFSKFADIIISNSHVGREYHLAEGYPADKTVVISNGIDTERFCPDPAARRRMRVEWNVSNDQRLVGIVGRLAPKKDHQNFLRAAALLAGVRKDVRFVCVGDGPPSYQATLQVLAQQLKIHESVIWVVAQDDVPAVYNALDVLVSSSSHGEGFANVVGEAMACGVPCVVTNVGDSAWVVGDRGEVVQPQDPVALMKAIDRSLSQPLCHSSQIRQRILDQSSEESLVVGTERILCSLLQPSLAR